jgi:uncharacterized protein YndB with AHSA1/START domain
MYAEEMTIQNKHIHHSIEIYAEVNEIWNRWTTEKGIKSFFASDCDIELKIGGKYEIYFLPDAEYGQKGSEGCKVLSYLPNRFFSFSWNAPPNFPDIRKKGPKTWVVIEITKLKNSTKVDLYHYGWKESEEWKKVYEYFDVAWKKVLQWLAQSFE